MITLFHCHGTRSTRFIFLLEELGVPYEIRPGRIPGPDANGLPHPDNPHPHGKVPAISDNGEVVFESPAIALYLTDKYRQNNLGPAVGEPGRGAYVSWLSYYTGVTEPAFLCKFKGWEAPRGTAGWPPVEEVLAAIIKQLDHGPYFLGEHFSAVDILYGTTFAMFLNTPLLPKTPVIEAYAQRVVSRPAFARAQAKDAG